MTKREVLISILKLTRGGPVEERLVGKDAGVSAEVLDGVLREIASFGLIWRKRGVVGADRIQRVKIAVHSITLGGDLELACRHLEWNEFEDIVAIAFEVNRYAVRKRFCFKWAGRRWEIDVLGFKEPNIVCVDCKHWRRSWSESAVAKAAGMQLRRVSALSEALPSVREDLGLTAWKRARLIPAVLSLIPAPSKFYGGVPVVPVLQLQNFLSELPAHVYALTFKLTILE